MLTIALFETLELVLSDCPQTHLICTKLHFIVFHAPLSVIFIVEKRNCKVIFSAEKLFILMIRNHEMVEYDKPPPVLRQ